MRKRQTEADSKMSAAHTDYYYDMTTPGGGTAAAYSKRPLANGSETNGCSTSPATEPLMAADRRLQQQQQQQQYCHLVNSNGTADKPHVVAVKCWPNGGVNGGSDVTMTSCSTFKMAPPETNYAKQTSMAAGNGGRGPLQQTLAC